MRPKAGQIGQKKGSLREYEKENIEAQEQRMFFTTLWLGIACLYIWLLMSFIF
jgi:hypothetical protein